MRVQRIKLDSLFAPSTTHLISRTINGEIRFSRPEKDKLHQLITVAAEFCGLEVWTYALMDTHPHLIVFVPLWTAPDDEELLRRYRILNPKAGGSKYRSMRLEVIAAHLRANTEFGVEWRRKQLAQMGDISKFMKIVKERFTVWYNKRHDRSGTIWGGRFKSLLVERDSGALLAMSTYVDANPVRAGRVRDPKDYSHSGYAAAVAGEKAARQGIMKITAIGNWGAAQAEYRKLLYAIMTKPRTRGCVLPIEEFHRVVAQGGNIPLADALGCRIRRFTDSLAFGSREWIEKLLVGFQVANRRKRSGEPRPMPPVSGWEDLATLRGLRGG
jgi:hypothetical protein